MGPSPLDTTVPRSWLAYTATGFSILEPPPWPQHLQIHRPSSQAGRRTQAEKEGVLTVHSPVACALLPYASL